MYKKLLLVTVVIFACIDLKAETFQVLENSNLSVDGNPTKIYKKGTSIKVSQKVCIYSGEILYKKTVFTKKDGCLKIKHKKNNILFKSFAYFKNLFSRPSEASHAASAVRGIGKDRKCILEVDTTKKYFVIPASKEDLKKYDIIYPDKNLQKKFFAKDKKEFSIPTKEIFDGMYIIIQDKQNRNNKLICDIKNHN